jgi:hypothetical protein
MKQFESDLKVVIALNNKSEYFLTSHTDIPHDRLSFLKAKGLIESEK